MSCSSELLKLGEVFVGTPQFVDNLDRIVSTLTTHL